MARKNKRLSAVRETKCRKAQKRQARFAKRARKVAQIMRKHKAAGHPISRRAAWQKVSKRFGMVNRTGFGAEEQGY